MKPLETLLYKNGFRYVQVKRNENFAIYTQEKEGFNYTYYEVIKIQVVKKDVNTKYLSLKAGTEFYPSSEKWGSDGWTYKTLEQAERKFNELIKREYENSRQPEEINQRVQEEI